jgi:CDP-glucose 4,6-dehydratase
LEGLALRPDFWRGKRVFLTGHTGFKGSWLSLWLQELGAEVTGFALAPPTEPSLFQLAHVGNGMDSNIGDIRDLKALQQAMNVAKPDIVFHMAAQALVRYAYENPVETYATNVMGTVNTLEAVRNTPSVRAVVIITTDKCYENREWVWGYRESEPMGGFDPYSNSKGCAELVSAAYRSSYFHTDKYADHGVALATARAGNVIGGGDWARDRLIPDILAAFSQGQYANIRNPEAIRPWQHVLEPLRGYLSLAERLFEVGPDYAEGWNFGPNAEDAMPVSWVAAQMAAMWGPDARWKIDKGDHPHEANYLKLDISKVRARLNWQPLIRLPRALELITDWARQHHQGANLHDFTLSQIQSYQRLATTP